MNIKLQMPVHLHPSTTTTLKASSTGSDTSQPNSEQTAIKATPTRRDYERGSHRGFLLVSVQKLFIFFYLTAENFTVKKTCNWAGESYSIHFMLKFTQNNYSWKTALQQRLAILKYISDLAYSATISLQIFLTMKSFSDNPGSSFSDRTSKGKTRKHVIVYDGFWEFL